MYQTKQLLPLTLGAACLATACTPDAAGATYGELDVALSSSQGDVDYHLTGATLRIDGPEMKEVSLDGSGTVSLTLPAGPYRLTLEEGWSLTREQGGDLEPVTAQLLSDNPVSLFLGAGASEALSFRFGIDGGEVVQSGEGALEVGFSLDDGGAPDGDTLQLGCAGALRINELDYDQQGTDTAEFVEILNGGVCDASLAGVAVELVNGSNDESYARVELDELGVLEPDGTLVIADQAVIDTLPEGTPALPLPGSGLQNGPDSVVLLLGDSVVDVVGYGEGAPEIEGEPAPEDDGEMSLGRCPNGFDTDDNGRDFQLQAPSPGVGNDC